MRGKLLTFFGQQEPSERKKLIQEYYNKDHLVRQFEDRQNISKPRRKRQHYQVDDSDDTPFNCCGDEDVVKKLYQDVTDILNHASELNALLVEWDPAQMEEQNKDYFF